jgi:hypothetical protein
MEQPAKKSSELALRNSSRTGRNGVGRVSVPKELGVLLVVAGIGGLLLPGPVGTPFLIVGCVTLWPAAFSRVEACFEKRLPRMHRVGMHQIERFVTDLERRYPSRR